MLDKSQIVQGRQAGFGRMDVRIRKNEHSSWPEPSADESWPPLRLLQWKAGTVHAQTGLDVTIGPGEVWHNGRAVPDLFAVHIADADGYTLHSSTGGVAEVWSFLNGVQTGIRCERGAVES